MNEIAPLIVVVDDDIDVLTWTELVLEEAGYRTRCCGSAAEAMKCMEEEAPALVITDLMMDSLHAGFSFAQQLREIPAFQHLPVIVVTAAASRKGFDFLPRTQADLEAMQVQAFFSKPVGAEALLEKIRALLAQADTGNDHERERTT